MGIMETPSERTLEIRMGDTCKSFKEYDTLQKYAESNKVRDKYEEEFDRIMNDQENILFSSEKHLEEVNEKATIMRDEFHSAKPSEITFNNLSNVKPNSDAGIIHSGTKNLNYRKNDDTDYPPELNPFTSDDINLQKSNNPFGNSDEENSTQITSQHMEKEREKCTNPFEDDDEVEVYQTSALLPPQPMPRHSVSTPTKELNSLKPPVPLPRITSKSTPSTPNQSPLLRANRSFRLPVSGHMLSGASSLTYNSIRRKKKQAPLPPQINVCPIQIVTAQSSSKTNERPRKTRMAPLPPSIKSHTMEHTDKTIINT